MWRCFVGWRKAEKYFRVTLKIPAQASSDSSGFNEVFALLIKHEKFAWICINFPIQIKLFVLHKSDHSMCANISRAIWVTCEAEIGFHISFFKLIRFNLQDFESSFCKTQKMASFQFWLRSRSASAAADFYRSRFSGFLFQPWDVVLIEAHLPLHRLFSRQRRPFGFFAVFHDRPIKSIANQVFLLLLLLFLHQFSHSQQVSL